MKFILVKIFIVIVGFVTMRSVESALHAREERNLASEKDFSNASAVNSPVPIVVTVQLSFTDYTNEDVIPALNITASQGTAAFQFLNLAAQQNPCYLFNYTTYKKYGRFITTICCVEQNTTTNFYWFVYINNTLSPVGVDSLIPKNGDILRFEYRFINSTGGNHTELAPAKSPNADPTGKGIGVKMISVSVELTFTNYPIPNVIPPQKIFAPNGTSAFEFLQLAAQFNPCYLFQYEQYSFGRYITTICCVIQNETTNFYWFIYINNNLSPVGADLLIPKDGDILKYEYMQSGSTNHTPSNPTSTMQQMEPSQTNTVPKGKGQKTFALNFIIYFSLAIGVLGWKFNEMA